MARHFLIKGQLIAIGIPQWSYISWHCYGWSGNWGWNERRFRNLASGPGDGRRCGGADRVVGERSVEAKFAHAWIGLAFAVQFFSELTQG